MALDPLVPGDGPFMDFDMVLAEAAQAMGGELTKIEDIVPIVLFLATDGWWITGQTLFANGGYTTR